MGILSGNPKDEPLHVGEVFSIWSYLAAGKGLLAGYEIYYNHAGDQDLKNVIQDIIENKVKPEIQELETLLKGEGVELPPAPPGRAKAEVSEIPTGARFNDNEIAMSIAKDLVTNLMACSTIMGQSIREDIGLLFKQYHDKCAQYGLVILRMQKEKGWLIHPPLHLKRPEKAGVTS